MTVDQGRTALYRLYDADGKVLYIGIARDPEVRFVQHKADKEWWPDVADKSVEWYESRCAAECAEQAAIKTHVPRYNYVHSPEPPTVKVTAELNATQVRGVDILCRALSKAVGAPSALSREDLLWCLVDRELASRGLLGDAPCYYSVLGWPGGVESPSCESRSCHNPYCASPGA